MDGVAAIAALQLPTHPPGLAPNDGGPTFHPTPPPPPAPAPPPPPPPPPPPAPPCFGGDPFVRSVHRRSKMRNFNWDTIPRHSVEGKRNVWTSRRKLEDFPLDTKRIEELFSHSEQQRMPRRGGTVKKSVWGLQSTSQESEVVSILNSKKSMNIGILLKQFKRPMQDIVEDVRQGNMHFAAGRLKELSKLLPDDVEVKKLLSFSGDLSQLSEADRFLLMLVKVPGYEERLKSLLLREEFFPFLEETKNSIAVMTAAANELLACDDLHSIIRLVLKAGNYMNAGGYAGRAIGFRMTSLLRLVDTKANKPGMNLMHYVAMQAQQIDSALLNFAEQLQHIAEASRIQKQEVESDLQRELEKIEEGKVYASKQPDLLHQMEEFLQVAERLLADVEASLQELGSITHSVAEYFCEDPATFKLEECCSIFHSFCEKFERAVQENRERELAERRRRQKQEKEALTRTAKRRSIATCSGRDLDTNPSALESVLTNFLTDRPVRRRQPSSNRASPTERTYKTNPLAGVSQIVPDSPTKVDEEEKEVDASRQEPPQQAEAVPSIAVEVQGTPAGKKRGLSIEDATTPKSNDCKMEHGRSLLGMPEPVLDEEEVGEKDNQQDEEKLSVAVDIASTPAGKKRGLSIEDAVTPKSSDHKLGRCRSLLIRAELNTTEEDDGEKNSQKNKHEEAAVLLFHSSPNQDHVPLRQRLHDSSRTPVRRGLQEMDLTLQTNLGGIGSPWTVLSPGVSPRITPHRRHSFTSGRDDDPDDGVWALPDTPVRSKPPTLPHSYRTYEHSVSTSVLTGTGRRASPCTERVSTGTSVQGLGSRSASVGEAPESVPSFRLGGLFQRRHGQEPPASSRQETSALISFFKRFGERGRPASVADA